MTGRNEMPDEDERLDAVLGALGAIEPGGDLQRRVLRRLAAEPVMHSRSTLLGWLRAPRYQSVVAAAVCAVCAAALLLQFGRHRKSLDGSNPSVQRAGAELLRPAAPGAHRLSPSMDRSAARPADPILQAQRAAASLSKRDGGDGSAAAGIGASHHNVASPALASVEGSRDAALIASAHEASFPAPEMPLTEQERLLIQIAHRNDPVQVAMLDPVERNLQLARERAESARFFAPPPLPPELQHEIDAALRSQYVNTPPPPMNVN